MQIVHLYGFASGPDSDKAQFFRSKFESAGLDFHIYDYIPNPHEFSNMKISELHNNLHQYMLGSFHNEKVILMGSSFGGLLVTLYAHLHPEKVDRLILIAPALRFTAEFITQTLCTSLLKWEKEGETHVEHYRFGAAIPLKYSFLMDLRKNPIPMFSRYKFPIPTIVFHGDNDEVVPAAWSVSFAQSNPRVKTYILKGDHQLLDHKIKIWNEIESEFKIN